MSKYLDINALTDEVLASVETEEIEKTASTEEEVKTEIGKAIKEAAANIREHSDTEITNEDVAELVKAAREKMAVSAGQLATTGLGAMGGGMLGGPLGAVAGGYGGYQLGKNDAIQGMDASQVAGGAGGPAGAILGQASEWASGSDQQAQQPQQMQNPAAPAAKTGSATGNELRKVANEIRKQGAANEEIKLTKAAKMLTAAVGLSHLTEDVK